MAVYSARQSSYTTGDTITAAHTNNEFNAILAAFHVSTGHTHDGTTAGDGGPLSTLYSNAISMGTGADTDIVLTFNANSNDGVLTWMEDEDYFKFSDDLLINSTEKVQFRDTAIYLYSSADGQLDVVADSVIQVTAPTVNIEASTAATIESDSITLGENGNTDVVLTFNATSNDGVLTWMEDEDYFKFSDDVLINSTEKLYFYDTGLYIYSSTDGQLDLVADTEIQIAATTVDINGNVDISGTLTIGSAGISEAELEILDGATVTTTELNIIDGDTTASSTTVADADRVVYNDAGTMKQVAVTDLDTYVSGTTKTLTNKTLTSPVLNTGVSGTAVLDEDNMASDSATKLATQQSIKAYVDAVSTGVTTFVMEDDDGTEVTISNNKEIKFIGSGLTTNWTDTDNGTDGDPYDITFTVDAAQTGITSILATDLKIGEDDETKIDFETANEIHFYASNTEQVYLADNIFGPQSDSDVDLGTTGVRWKDAYIDTITTTGAITVGGDLTVNGTTTTVNSTTVTIDDPIFTLGGDSAPSSDDNKDRGIEFRYHTGSAAKVGFFGYDDSASAFTFIADATNSSEVFSGTAGNVAFGDIAGTLTTAAQTNITSVGALDGGSITSGFGAIDNGTSGIRTNTFTAETSILPDAVGGADLGSTSAEWGDVYIADDKKIYFGNDQDVSMEYDEDGIDTLLISGDITLADDKKLYFGTGKDVSIEYDEDGIDTLLISGGDVTIADDKKLYFGTGKDVSLEYDEDGNDTLSINGDVLVEDDKKLYFGSGKDVSLEYDEDGNDTLSINGDALIEDDKKLYLGSGKDFSIEYDENGNDTTAVVAAGGLSMAPHGTSSGNGTELRFQELAANGANYVGFKAPDSISSNEIWVLPNADGTDGQALKTNGSNTLSWGSVGYLDVPNVGAKSSSYTLATADVGKFVQVQHSITIPNSTFSEGDVISLYNDTSGDITVTCTITTAYISGTNTDKNTVTLATRGIATILFISGTVCVITGSVS